jgi:hypothetical protein
MKNIKLITLLIAMTLIATSCDKWLDVKPKTMQPASTMFDTYQGYRNALSGCYQKMQSRDVWGQQMTMSAVEFLAQHWEIYDAGHADIPVMRAAKAHEYLDDNLRTVFQRMFSALFNIVVQTNTIIEAMPLTGETAIGNAQARGVIEGEAYAIRALCHFEVLRLFGQVPGGSITRNLPYTEGVSHLPTGYIDYQTYIKKIEDDLTKAADLLFEHDPSVQYSFTQTNANSDDFLRYRRLRLNYWAVKGLQARFYLYTAQNAKAYAAAMDVVDAARTNQSQSFGLEVTNDLELDFYALPFEGLFVLSNHNLRNYSQRLFRGKYTISTGSSSAPFYYMSLAKMEGTGGTFGMFGHPKGNPINNRYEKVWNTRGEYETMFELLKYDQTTNPQLDNVTALDKLLRKDIIPILRLSEMYLIVMETTDNLTLINDLYDQYRRGRGTWGETVFDSKQEVMQMIELEYRREFFGEGQMFFFYKRNNARTMVWTEITNERPDGFINEIDYIVPLPASETTN